MICVVRFELDGGFVELKGLPELSNGVIFIKCWNFLRGSMIWERSLYDKRRFVDEF